MSRGTNTGKGQQDGVELLSVKELCLEVQGRGFLARTGYTPLFEDTKALPYFDKIRGTWQMAVREINVGTPKGLKADSIEEQIQIESFFIEFRLGDPARALKKYSPLMQKHSEDQVFLNAIAKTNKRRSIPNEAPLSLAFHILENWLHGFLWGLSNEERADVLRRAYGVTIRSTEGGESEVVRKTVARLKLKSWSDYRDAYRRPPFSLLLFRDEEQQQCQIVFSSTGQS